jgi:hypothetical protein
MPTTPAGSMRSRPRGVPDRRVGCRRGGVVEQRVDVATSYPRVPDGWYSRPPNAVTHVGLVPPVVPIPYSARTLSD